MYLLVKSSFGIITLRHLTVVILPRPGPAAAVRLGQRQRIKQRKRAAARAQRPFRLADRSRYAHVGFRQRVRRNPNGLGTAVGSGFHPAA